MTYASSTSVPVDRTRSEIEKTLTRFGATKFASGWDQLGATIAFEAKGRYVRFILPLPVEIKGAGKRRDQIVRARWRALLLCIKAKLEACESGISNFESEFLAHVILPTGETVGEHLAPRLADAYSTGKMPPLLGSGS
jgi:hypothetical protein